MKHLDPSTKLTIALESHRPGVSVISLARRYGTTRTTVYAIIKRLTTSADLIFGYGNTSEMLRRLTEENDRLRDENHELRMTLHRHGIALPASSIRPSEEELEEIEGSDP